MFLSPLRCFPIIMLAFLVLLPAGRAQTSDEANDLDIRVDRAINAGMRWLSDQQVVQDENTARWDSPKFSSAVTSLAGLALLANGQLPGEGEHGEAVRRALNFVVRNKSGADVGSGGAYMYEHAISSLFVFSCIGLDDSLARNNELSDWCHASLEIILKAQEINKSAFDKGGWRYRPTSDESDLSVTSWQLLVLHAARQCGYKVNMSAVRYALNYVNRGFVQIDDATSGYIYRPGHQKEPEYGVTGTSILIKSIFEAESDTTMSTSINYLKQFKVGWGGDQYRGFFFFNTLYMLQGFFQVGGSEYDDYSRKIKELLVREQKGDGHWPYPPKSRAERQGVGDIYPTAMCVLLLSLDKQYLPIFQRQQSIYR